VLLVHGLASNARLWDGVAAGLVAAGHRAVAVDQRGHGHSDVAADGPTRDGVLDDLVDVTTALDLDRPVVVGQSWGGNVVLDLAADRPGVARSVACVDGGFIDLRASFDDHASMRAALDPPRLDGTPYDDVETQLRTGTADWPDAGTLGQLGNLVRNHDGTVTAALRRPEHHAIMELLWERSPLDVAGRIDVPVLLLPATQEAEPPAAKLASVQALADRLDRVRIHWATLAHHDVHAQRPDEVVDVLLDAIRNDDL
jgi:pimeloyl-ACP methyl ester carboxylesterase